MTKVLVQELKLEATVLKLWRRVINVELGLIFENAWMWQQVLLLCWVSTQCGF